MPEEKIEEVKIDVGTVADVLDRMFEKDPNATPPEEIPPNTPPLKKTPPEENPLDGTKKDEPGKKTEEESDDLPENLPNEGRSDAWKKFKTAHKETKQEIVALKQQLSEFEGTKKERDELKGRITGLETDLAEARKIDSLSKLENSPEFQSKYVKERGAAIDKLKELAGYSDIEPSDILGALSKTGKERITALEYVLSNAPSVLKNKLVSLIDKVDEIDTARQAELSNAGESLSRLEKQRQKETEAREKETTERFKSAFNETAASLPKELGVDEATINEARKFYLENGDLKEAAKTVIRAFVADKSIKSSKDQATKIAELETELAKYRESNPSLQGGATRSVSDIPADADFVTSIMMGRKKLGI